MSELPLRDIHLPPSIAWWPPAAGYWLVGALLLGGGILVSLALWRVLRPSLKKSARQQLCAIEQRFEQDGTASTCVAELSQLLRRVVLSQKKYQHAAGLTGLAWLKLLDKGLDRPAFSQGEGQLLLKGPYSPAVEEGDVQQLIQLCHKWVKRL